MRKRKRTTPPRHQFPPRPGPPPKLLSLSLQPRAVTLRGKDASQQFLLTGNYSDGVDRDLSRQARFSLSDPRLGRVDDQGQMVALAGGEARLTAEFGGLSAESTINVQSSASTRAPNFALDLEGIFTRQGCNDSHCHGSVKGPRRVQALQPGRQSQGGPPLDRSGRNLPDLQPGVCRARDFPYFAGGAREEPAAVEANPAGAPRRRPAAGSGRSRLSSPA